MKLILLVVPILAVTALPQSHIPEITTSNSFRQPVVVPVASQRASLDDLLDGSAGCGGPNTECVPYHLCNNQVPMENLVDITLSDSGPCPGSLDVCCVSANKVTEPLFEPPKLTSQGCGFRSTEGIGFRISGGKDNEAQFGEFPWMTAVLHKQLRQGQEINVYLCGGSLIHPRVVLTAAHCVAEKPNNVLKVRLGEWDTQTTSEPLPFQDRDVVEVNIHPGFKSQALANDVALLFLDSPVTIAENVKTVCLPEVSENFDHRRCFATGWGKDKFGVEGKYQVILKKIDLPIIPQDVCQDKLRTTRLSQYFELHNSFICAGGEKDKDTCKGDGGSPLVCPISPNSNRYYQAGIVAWGIGCGQSDVPGVYVKVSEFKEWIDKSLREKDINQISYTP